MRKRKLDRGEPSDGLMAARAVELGALGFAWEPKELADAPGPAEASHPHVGERVRKQVARFAPPEPKPKKKRGSE